jgi:hypothetical protein
MGWSEIDCARVAKGTDRAAIPVTCTGPEASYAWLESAEVGAAQLWKRSAEVFRYDRNPERLSCFAYEAQLWSIRVVGMLWKKKETVLIIQQNQSCL